MGWFAQNWIWIALIVGFFFLMRQGGCGGGMSRLDRHGGDTQHSTEGDKSATAIDPVNNAALDIAGALTSVYRGKVYYFASAENRVIFEAKPEQYIGSDQPDPHQHKTHRHGC